MRNLILFFLISLWFNTPVFSSETDSVEISLLTVLPRPNEVYTVYGHTAIRVRNITQETDRVFNYGTFDFNQPNFIWRFIKGQTDYTLSVADFTRFYNSYEEDNSTIIEQLLNLTEKETQILMQGLIENYEPENREYRYNYFFDNCTSRAREMIENHVEGEVVYSAPHYPVTFRHLVHTCTEPYPWMTFGIDLLIGSGADSIISFKNQMFLPVKLMEGLASAYIQCDSFPDRPLAVSASVIMISQEEEESGTSWFDPMFIGLILLCITIVLIIYGFLAKKRFRPWFGLLFLVAGCAGCLIWLVALASEHPCVFPNYNMLWLHPLHFLAVIGYVFHKTYSWVKWFHWSNFVLLSSVLISWPIIPQEFNAANVPFILCLWAGSGYWLMNKYTINKI